MVPVDFEIGGAKDELPLAALRDVQAVFCFEDIGS